MSVDVDVLVLVLVLVDVEGEGPEAQFTFKGEAKSELPDLPPIEEPATTAESE